MRTIRLSTSTSDAAGERRPRGAGRKPALLTGIPVAALCLILLALAVLNFDLLFGAVKTTAGEVFTAKRLTAAISEAYRSELKQKDAFIELNGWMMRASRRNTSNRVSTLTNGMLTQYIEKGDMSPLTKSVSGLSKLLHTNGIPFVYIQAPYKMDLAMELQPACERDYSNACADELLAGLSEKGVETLDLRPYVAATAEQVEKYFYRTDHHWNALGALTAFPYVLDEIESLTGELDKTAADPENWTLHRRFGVMLGSWGKRVGASFGGTDNFEWFTPDFETELMCVLPQTGEILKGDYETACLRMENLDDPSLMHTTRYNVFFGGAKPLMELYNAGTPNKRNIVIVYDSFAMPMLSYLQTAVSEIHAIDAREYGETGIADYALSIHPDLFIMMLSPSVFYERCYQDLGTAVAEGSRSEVKINNILIDSRANEIGAESINAQYNMFDWEVRMQRDCAYRLDIGSLTFTSGQPRAVMAALFDRERTRHVSTRIWVDGGSGFGSPHWDFACPDGYENKPLELLIYAGVAGETAGNVMLMTDVRLTESRSASGERLVYSESAVEAGLPAEKDYYYTLGCNVGAGRAYRLEIEGVTGVGCGIKAVDVWLRNPATGEMLNTRAALNGGSAVWRFRTRDTGEYLLVLGIPPTYCGGASVRIAEIRLYETNGASGEADYSAAKLHIEPKDNAYNCAVLPLTLRAGETYTLHTGRMTVLDGAAATTQAGLYRGQKNQLIASTSWVSARENDWTFTIPVGIDDCCVVLYAGAIGETAGNEVIYHDVALRRWNDAGENALLCNRAETVIEPKDNAFNMITLDVPLRGGHVYRLRADSYRITNAASDGIVFRLLDTRTGRVVQEKTWRAGQRGDPFEWTFLTPEDMLTDSDVELIVQPALNGQARWVGASLKNLMLWEVE